MGKGTLPSGSSLTQTALMGHVTMHSPGSVVLDGHGMIDAVSHRRSSLGIKEVKKRPRSFGGLIKRCISVRLSLSLRFVVLNATTVNRAMSLVKLSYRKGPACAAGKVTCVR